MSETRPLCVTCDRFMRCVRNGYRRREGDLIEAGDEYECPQCGIRIVTGWGEPWWQQAPREAVAR